MDTKSIVKWCDRLIVIGIFILTFAVPLFFDIHLYSTFDLSKVGMMFFITLILLSLWLVKMVTLGDFRSVRTPIDFVVLAFLLSNIASTLFSLNPAMSLFGCYKRYEGLLAITCYIVIYYLTVNFIKTKQQVLGILSSILIVGTISGGYALVQHFGMDPLSWESFNPWRIISFFGNPVFYTVYALMSFIIGFGLYLYLGKEKDEVKPHIAKPVVQKTKKKKKVEVAPASQPAVSSLFGNIGLSIITGLAVLLTYWGFSLGNTRGCYLGLFGGSVMFFCLVGKKILVMDKKRLIILGLGLFMLFFYYNIMVKESSVIQRFAGLFAKEDVSRLSPVEKAVRAQTPIKGVNLVMPWRIFIWRSAIETVKDYPILGTGPDTMGLVFPKYLKVIFPKDGKGPIEFEDRCHQDFLDHMVARGFIGSFIYIWGVICFLLLTWKFYRHSTLAGRPIILSLGASIIGYIIQNQVSFSVTPVSCTLAIVAGILVRSGWVFLQPATTATLSNNPMIDRVMNTAFFSGCSFTPQELKNAEEKPKNENVLYVGYILILCGLMCVSYLTWRMYVADRYYKMGTVFLGRDNQRAIGEYQKAINSFPYEVRYRDELNRAYVEQARGAATDEERILWAKKAAEGASEILRRTPGYANGYFTLGIANYLLSKTENDEYVQKAVECYKKAAEINPFSADTYNNLGVIYTRQNKLDDAIIVFKEAYRINPGHAASLDNIARIYITKNEPENALKTLEELQELDPNYQPARIQNMIGYLCWQLGRFDEVVERCKKVLEADPKDISALENLGTVYMKKGMYREAAMQFQRVLEIEPNNPKALRMLQSMTGRR